VIETVNSDGGEIAVPEFHRHPRRKGKPLSAEYRAKLSAVGKREAPANPKPDCSYLPAFDLAIF
jgi:hypothetical protein